MKKHPVDDLFKRRLEGLERTPSENAWLKIQEKQPAKHRSAVWGWYAAAGVAAAVMGGYLVWQNQQVASPGGIRSNPTVAVAKPAPSEPAVLPVDNTKQPIEHLAAMEGKSDEHAVAGSKQTSEIPETGKNQLAQSEIRQAEIIRPGYDAPVVAITEKPSVLVETIQPEPVNTPDIQGAKILPDEPAVSQVNKPVTEPTRMIVVAVETGTDEADDKPRGSRFSRVFRQLKNARAGEKVDWNEVGFNPKNLVARVDDRLRGKDERSNERDHPKDKTKL
ncbi:hypothetical protein GCM10007423_54920 [Dyadobacter endophyticus]|uniref:Uncharacterized protein n=1 Tax=Dyadobacter endophyticus TaxID=1749036 RepID=A0ABQ1Z5Y1_9BACT|nr:hypothetical protein [Dyadobacter endophyticus]GGH51462.1 hypothetical protein GCM10007423_54920 [Dyadobacter endophyticus]